jgi:hypothetical protein
MLKALKSLKQKSLKQKTSNVWKIVEYEGGLKIKYIHDWIHNFLLGNLFQKITIYLMKGINFITLLAL